MDNLEIEIPTQIKSTPEKDQHPSVLDIRTSRVEDRTDTRITEIGRSLGKLRLRGLKLRKNLNECLR